MENVIDLIAKDATASDISDAIKASLYSKAAERVDAARPIVANSLFGIEPEVEESEEEIEQEPQEEE
jgi:hypothetical protein